MFVRSRMSRDMIYRKGGKDWVIKAGTISTIDENIVSAQELKSLYGTRIEIISRGWAAEPKKEAPKVAKAEPKKETPKAVKPQPPKKLNNELIDDILVELKKEEQLKEPPKREEPKEPPKQVARRRTTAKKAATKRATRRSKKQP
jgi:hypothetical protein